MYKSLFLYPELIHKALVLWRGGGRGGGGAFRGCCQHFGFTFGRFVKLFQLVDDFLTFVVAGVMKEAAAKKHPHFQHHKRGLIKSAKTFIFVQIVVLCVGVAVA